jgi:hypothetical protein
MRSDKMIPRHVYGKPFTVRFPGWQGYAQDTVTQKDTSSKWDWWIVPFAKVPRKGWISHTRPMWLWGYSLLKILSPRPLLYGARWIPRCPCKTLYFTWRVELLRGWNRVGCTIDHWRLRSKGGLGVPLMHSFIHKCNVHTNLWWKWTCNHDNNQLPYQL